MHCRQNIRQHHHWQESWNVCHLTVGQNVSRFSPADSACHVIMPDCGDFPTFTGQTTPVILRMTGGCEGVGSSLESSWTCELPGCSFVEITNSEEHFCQLFFVLAAKKFVANILFCHCVSDQDSSRMPKGVLVFLGKVHRHSWVGICRRILPLPFSGVS